MSRKGVQLLKECKRLKSLRLHFESDLISNKPVDDFEADPGLRELGSVRGLDRVEIWAVEYEPLEQYSIARRLKEKMESSRTPE